jgi:hypothetical protein
MVSGVFPPRPKFARAFSTTVFFLIPDELFYAIPPAELKFGSAGESKCSVAFGSENYPRLPTTVGLFGR